MSRYFAVRILACALAFVTGLAPSALALVHGHEHEHAAEARHAFALDDHRDGRGSSADSDEHPHQILGASVASRSNDRLLLDVARPAAAADTYALPPIQSVAARRLTAAPARAGVTSAPRPPTRAPPHI